MFGPNITGLFHEAGNNYMAEGCFYTTNQTGGWVDGGSGGITKVVNLDASRSSGFFGNSSTVQPGSLRLLLCIKC